MFFSKGKDFMLLCLTFKRVSVEAFVVTIVLNSSVRGYGCGWRHIHNIYSMSN